ncbi:predicted protein [Sclerotinia sclerotiorum 1980 UF-70]|uniref:Uncharacterized protein n=1 Tax=Sclerotinia sclerotiorum (strain ATCC 18683 / 1980 / Ss-1) TaxID=665079 RepID=A7EIN1_SCLS1|nr:predicted protein [Sclerotinia sclerotiorum 1980 UF-70]EDO02697.1 predicted protein [Sclerotinia sclerotiorum 1980 UF-70]
MVYAVFKPLYMNVRSILPSRTRWFACHKDRAKRLSSCCCGCFSGYAFNIPLHLQLFQYPSSAGGRNALLTGLLVRSKGIPKSLQGYQAVMLPGSSVWVVC